MDEDYPEKGLIKRTPIDEDYDEEDIPEEDIPDYDDDYEETTKEPETYKSKDYTIDEGGEEDYGNVPSIVDQAIEEDSHSEEAEREALEKDILEKLRRDRDPIGNVEYVSDGPIDPEDEKRAIRVLLRQDDSIDGIKKIAEKFKVDMKRVLAIKDEMEDERRRMEHEQKILMQQRMMEIKNPEIPRHSSRSMNYDDYDDDYEEDYRPPPKRPRYEQQFNKEVNPPSQYSGDLMGTLLTFMLNQATTADKRSFDMMQMMMQNNQQQMQMWMESNNKGKGGFFDGEFGDVLKAKMMANVLSPRGGNPEVSGTALILKGLVDSGQLGGILTEATGLLRDLASKDKDEGYEPLDIDAGDISSLPPQYREERPRQRPPRQTKKPRKIPEEDFYNDIDDDDEEEYDYSYEEPQAQKPSSGVPKSLPPEGVEFEPYTAEWYALEICKRFPDTEWDVALKSSELVVKRAQMSGANLSDPGQQKEVAMSILAVIGGAQGVITLARAARELMEFDSKGDHKRSPEEAAEFIKEHMPEKVNVIKAFDWNMMMDTASHFESCKSMSKAIVFLRHPKVMPIVKKFLLAVKTAPMPKRPPNVNDSLPPEGNDAEFEENPFGGF